MKKILRFKSVIAGLLFNIVLFMMNKELFMTSVGYFKGFIIEMGKVMPPVMIITALISVWIPSNTIMKGLGPKSGIKGVLISFLTGALSSGPIYAGFPACLVLYKKGASIRNIVIILSSWAVIKLPMFFIESSFLGLSFSSVRYLITIPVILIIALLMEKSINKRDIEVRDELTLPMLDCRTCGYSSCSSFKEAYINGEAKLEECIVLKKRI